MTDDMLHVMRWHKGEKADIVVVMVPPNFYEALLAPCADILRDDQLVLLSPGGIGGALLISRLVARSALKLLVGQTWSMPHAAHLLEDGGIRVTGKKKKLSVGVFPSDRTQELLDRLSGEFPQVTGSANVIENGLSSATLGVHPVPMIMNAAQIGGHSVDRRRTHLYQRRRRAQDGCRHRYACVGIFAVGIRGRRIDRPGRPTRWGRRRMTYPASEKLRSSCWPSSRTCRPGGSGRIT